MASTSKKLDFEEWKNDLLAKTDRGMKFGKSIGANDLELYITRTRSLNISIQSGLVNAKQGGQVGIGCRCITNNKIGFASTSGMSDEDVNFVIESALNVSKSLREEDKRWKSFVSNSSMGSDGMIYDDVVNCSSEDAVTGANSIFKEAKSFDDRVIAANGNVQIAYGAFAVANTEGLAKASRTTFGVGMSYITAKSGDKTKTGFHFLMGRGVPEFEGIGKNGAEKAVKMLDSQSLNQTGEMKVIMDNIASGQLISVAMSNSVNGMSVVEGRSAFADKIGDQVGISSLNIFDDPQIPEDPNMSAIDDEGYPRSTKAIVKDGVLMSFIFNQYYSKIFETENTGNATRGGQQSYESLPSISSSTISVTPGNKTLEKIIEETGNGIIVTGLIMGMGHANRISGDFSVVSPSAYKVENGEITNPVESITVAGNLYKSFNQITMMGNDNELTFLGKIPSMAFDGFTVSG